MGKLNIPHDQMPPEVQEIIHNLHNQWRDQMNAQPIQPGHAIGGISHFLGIAILSLGSSEREAQDQGQRGQI